MKSRMRQFQNCKLQSHLLRLKFAFNFCPLVLINFGLFVGTSAVEVFVQDDNVGSDYSDNRISERSMTGGGLRGAFDEFDIDAMEVDSNYSGPKLTDGKVTLQFMKGMINLLRKDIDVRERKIDLKYVLQILRAVNDIYQNEEESLIEIKVPADRLITVVGDIHGHKLDLIHIFTNISGLPSDTNFYLFNGDFVDRGEASLECALILFGFKLLYPKTFFINRGNHEDREVNDQFRRQCDRVYGSKVTSVFQQVWDWLPLTHRINERVLVLHGGLFEQENVTLDDIRHIKRGRSPIYANGADFRLKFAFNFCPLVLINFGLFVGTSAVEVFMQDDNVGSDYSDIRISERSMTGGGLRGAFDEFDIDAMEVDSNYTGPKLIDGKVTLQFMKGMINLLRKDIDDSPKNKIHLKYVLQILRAVNDIYQNEKESLIEIKVPADRLITVVGDIHGHVLDLIHIFTNISGLPSDTNFYLFNGDFVDNGYASVQCALILFGFKLLYPKTFFINRGNHEDRKQNHKFTIQCDAIYGSKVTSVFQQVWDWLPLAHRINEKVLVLHGGLFKQENVTLDDIRHIKRGRSPPYNNDGDLLLNILWSDPRNETGIRRNSQRGGGICFGPDVTSSFCKRNGIDYVIRSHEPKRWGYEVAHDGRLITVFSTAGSFYQSVGINSGAAVVKICPPELKPHFVNYTEDHKWASWRSFKKQGV